MVKDRVLHVLIQDLFPSPDDVDFTFAWVSDTQYYSDSYPDIYKSMMQYIVDQKEEKKTDDGKDKAKSKKEEKVGVKKKHHLPPKSAQPVAPTVEVKQNLKTECESCLEPHKDLLDLPCQHSFCTACIRGLFQTAVTDKELVPVKCCGKRVDQRLRRDVLQLDELDTFEKLLEESDAAQKLYWYFSTPQTLFPFLLLTHFLTPAREEVAVSFTTWTKCKQMPTEFSAATLAIFPFVPSVALRTLSSPVLNTTHSHCMSARRTIWNSSQWLSKSSIPGARIVVALQSLLRSTVEQFTASVDMPMDTHSTATLAPLQAICLAICSVVRGLLFPLLPRKPPRRTLTPAGCEPSAGPAPSVSPVSANQALFPELLHQVPSACMRDMLEG